MKGTIYLLHFNPRYRHAGHYLGWASDLDRRLEAHRTGAGARLTQVAVAAGCQLILARTWNGTRADEYSMKYSRVTNAGKPVRRHSLTRLCPICSRLEVLHA